MAYEIKTKVNDLDVLKFLNSIEDDKQKEDTLKIYELMKKISKEKARMFGKSIVGFGLYSYESKAKCMGEWFYLGLSPRKGAISIYVMSYENKKIDMLKKDLGKTKLGRCCISIKKIEDIDMKVLEKILKLGFVDAKEKYG